MTEGTETLPYQFIWKACLTIAAANGGLNRWRNEEEIRGEFLKWMTTRTETNLIDIDRWLGSLSDEDFETICDGEVTEVDAIMQTAPAGPRELLDDYFEEVC